MATLTQTPCVVAFDDGDSPCDVVDGLAVGACTSGERPWARTLRIERVRAEATLVPAGAEVVREASDRDREVGPLSPAEARRWLGHPAALPGGEATLAELYARRGDLRTVAHRDQPAASGQYL